MMAEKRTHADWARDYPLWMARYTSLWPSPIYPWAGWDFWQYSDSGKIPGVKTHVDLNWFNGSEEELVERFTQDGYSYVPQSNEAVEENNMSDEMADAMDPKTIVFEMAKNINPQYKGDYQEARQETKRYFANGRGRRMSRHSGKIRHTSDEVQWVRSYFVDKALGN